MRKSVMARSVSTVALLGALLAAIPASAQRASGKLDDARLANAASDPSQWITIGGTYAETRYSPLDKINLDTVKDLKLAWYGDFDTTRGQEATPLVIDGVLYTSTAWSKVFAYDAKTGKQLWKYDPQIAGKKGQYACCDVVNRGLAAYDGKVIIGALDGRLIAIDMKTGKEVWSVQTTDVNKPYTITGAPRVAKGKVIIGNGGAELGVRGYVTAYDANTGKQAWRFYFTPNPDNKPDGAASDKFMMSTGYQTWGNGWWKKTGGGGTAWDAIVYDPEYNQVLVGVGNGSPWAHAARNGVGGGKGDNLLLSSVVALDPDTGAYKWHYQETPGEEWDFTSVQPIMLGSVDYKGKQRKVLMHAPKNGIFYMLDRKDGALVAAKPYTKINWASGVDPETGRPIEYPSARYSQTGKDFLAEPSAFGSHNWHPMSFNPKTGLVYVPVQEIPLGFKAELNFVYKPGHGIWNLADVSTQPVNIGPTNEPDRIQLGRFTRGALVAWNPSTMKQVWRVEHPDVGAGGLLSTAGNLIFQGTPDGVFHAFRADDGREVWKFDSHVGIVAGAMTYVIDGEQYIAVLSGFGGANGFNVPYIDSAKPGKGRILVFKLNGTASLPAHQPTPKRPATMVKDASFTPEMVEKGAANYGNCVFCHGFQAISLGVIPDLRRTPLIADKEAFKSVVLDGALESRGMPSMKGRLTEEQLETIRAYLADRAKQAAVDDRVKAAAEN